MVKDTAIVTMADQKKVACGLSNGRIFSDLERPLTWFSRSRTLNNSKTATDTAHSAQARDYGQVRAAHS